jgi:hypothetical protein
LFCDLPVPGIFFHTDERPGSDGAGYAYLQAEVLLTINKGKPVAHGTIAIGTTCAALVGAAAYGLKRLKSITIRA